MKRGRSTRFFLRDYPWAVRARLGSARERAVPASYDEGTLAPVLLLPGVYETWHYLKPIADRLSVAGHPIVAMASLRFNRAPIRATAAMVWSEVVARDLRGVVLVAHSKGGLIGKHLLAIDDTEQRIERMVAVAAPFAGSSLARWAPNRSLRDFRVDDPLVRALAEERAVNERITSIYPALDPHIPEGSELAGATNVRIAMAGHFGPLFDPRGVDAVLAAVDPPRATAAGSGVAT